MNMNTKFYECHFNAQQQNRIKHCDLDNAELAPLLD